MTIRDDEVLVSFDVKSLYTSVPIEPALQAVGTLLENDQSVYSWSNGTNLKSEEILHLLEICLRESSFKFRGQFYEMTNGLAMGCPVSPIVANIFMSQLEEKAINDMPSKPSLWLRFVDDVLAIVKRRALQVTLETLNAQHDDIAFTMEVEENGQLPYLDARIARKDNQLLTSVYRKPTDTGRYLSFDSHHPISCKRSTVDALLSRALTVPTDDEEKEREVGLVQEMLTENSYPRPFIKQQLSRLRKKQENTRTQQDPDGQAQDDPKSVYSTTIVVPFLDGITQAIQRVLRPLEIRVVGRPQRWDWSLQRNLKDSVEPCDEIGAVYRINCMDCDDIYIGETGRTTRIRCLEHKSHARCKRTDHSAAADHVLLEGHKMDFDNPVVLDRDKRLMSRRVKEALWLYSADKKMNRDQGLELNPLWFSVL